MPTIAIVSPMAMSYVTGTIQVEVRVTGGTASQVQLLRDDMAWQTLPGPPFVYSWATAASPDGVYILTAKATVGGIPVMSDPVTVTIDHTPPQVTNVVPTRGNLSVSLVDPITVTFSEPVAPATVSNSSVQLTAGGTSVGSTAMLSADGQSLTVTITNPKSVSIPADVTATVSTAITDRAGNPLMPLDPAWTWTVPAWIKLPPLASDLPPRLALDKSRRPVLLHVTPDSGGSDNVSLARFENGAWNTAIGSPSTYAGSAYNGYSLDLDSAGHPVVAWTERPLAQFEIHVGAWTGTTWNTQFPALSAITGTSTDATMPSVRVDGSDRPVVVWKEVTATAGPTYDLFVARWSGTDWTRLNDTGPMGGAGFSQIFDGPQIAVGPQGNPIYGWHAGGGAGAGLSFWSGTAWSRSQALTGNFTPYPIVDATGAPLVAAMGTDLHVFKWDTSIPNWTEPSSPLTTSASWQGPRVAVAPDGSYVVAWLDTTSTGRIGVARWSGSSWDTRFGLFNAGASAAYYDVNNGLYVPPELAVDAQGAIWVAWKEGVVAQVWMSNL
jgi:hypothetical protein